MKTNEEFIQEENLQFYAANVAAWFNTRLEYDKSLLVLSTGGVGLLLTLFTSLGASSITVLVLYALANTSFLGAVISLLLVFKLNSGHIEEVLQQAHSDASAESEAPDSAKVKALTSRVLRLLDWSVMAFFGVGLALSVSLGIVTGYSSYVNKLAERRHQMTDSSKNKGVPVFDSVNGVANLQPKALLQKSFNGVGNLAPKAVAGSAASSASVQPTTQASAAMPTVAATPNAAKTK